MITDAVEYFERLIECGEHRKSVGVAAIETLFRSIERSQAKTVNELTDELKSITRSMSHTNHSLVSVRSASEVFMRFISLANAEQNVQEFRLLMDLYKKRGEFFIGRVAKSPALISRFARPFIQSEKKILVHSYSNIVLGALVDAKNCGINPNVFVTESNPDASGHRMAECLKQADIQCTLIFDVSVGCIMETIDMVFFGAEGVMETGGIINRVGTLTVAMCAKAMNKPVYVMAESIKFVKEYPLNQSDIPIDFKYDASALKRHAEDKDFSQEHPRVDYTPPQYINLLFTDLGILTPAAVGDELIKLYT